MTSVFGAWNKGKVRESIKERLENIRAAQEYFAECSEEIKKELERRLQGKRSKKNPYKLYYYALEGLCWNADQINYERRETADLMRRAKNISCGAKKGWINGVREIVKDIRLTAPLKIKEIDAAYRQIRGEYSAIENSNEPQDLTEYQREYKEKIQQLDQSNKKEKEKITIKKITEKQYEDLINNIREAAEIALSCTAGQRGEVWMDLSTGDSACSALMYRTCVNPTKEEELVFRAYPCLIEEWLFITSEEKKQADADARPEYKDLKDWFLNHDDPNDNALNQTQLADDFLNEHNIDVEYRKDANTADEIQKEEDANRLRFSRGFAPR